MATNMGGYPDNMRGGVGGPYPATKYRFNSDAAKDRTTLFRIAAVLELAARDVEELQQDLHIQAGLLAASAVPNNLRATAEEIQRDDVGTVMEAECV